MALEQPYDEADGLAEGRPETRIGRGETRGKVPEESAEPRSRGEYYEILRAADDGEAADADESGEGISRGERADGGEVVADRPEDNGGWETVDAGKRPLLDAISIDQERTTHILDGDPGGGGGHRHGVGRPRKTEFPAAWDDDKILGNVLDVAKRPDSSPVLQDRNNRWICTGTRESVEISVILLRTGEVWTAWPEEGGPGVVRNPKKGTS